MLSGVSGPGRANREGGTSWAGRTEPRGTVLAQGSSSAGTPQGGVGTGLASPTRAEADCLEDMPPGAPENACLSNPVATDHLLHSRCCAKCCCVNTLNHFPIHEVGTASTPGLQSRRLGQGKVKALTWERVRARIGAHGLI